MTSSDINIALDPQTHHTIITDPQDDSERISTGSGKCCDKSAGGCDCEIFVATASDSTMCICGHSWGAHY